MSRQSSFTLMQRYQLAGLMESEQELSYRKQSAHLETSVRGHSRSLKLVPFESLGAVSYSPSIVTMAVSVAVCEIFSVKEWHDLENQVRGRSRSLQWRRSIDHK